MIKTLFGSIDVTGAFIFAGAVAAVILDSLEYVPQPNAFLALYLNRYVLPAVNPVTVNVVIKLL